MSDEQEELDWWQSPDGWAYQGWARQPQHSEVKRLAPTSEAALTITCGRRVLARVWPRRPLERQFLVTAFGRSKLLDDNWPAAPAPCACDRRVHLLDRAALIAAVEEYRDVPASRKPEVDVARVSRAKGD